MSDILELSVTPTDRQRDLMEEAVRSGEYATTDEIVREALREWQERREGGRIDAAAFRALWDAGKASGEPRPLDFGELRAEAREGLREAGETRA